MAQRSILFPASLANNFYAAKSLQKLRHALHDGGLGAAQKRSRKRDAFHFLEDFLHMQLIMGSRLVGVRSSAMVLVSLLAKGSGFMQGIHRDSRCNFSIRLLIQRNG